MSRIGSDFDSTECEPLAPARISQLLTDLARVRELMMECIGSPSDCKKALICHQIREATLPLCELSLVRVVEVLNSSVASLDVGTNELVDHDGISTSTMCLRASAEVIDDVVCHIESLRDGYQGDDSLLENIAAKISCAGVLPERDAKLSVEHCPAAVMADFLDDVGRSLQVISTLFLYWQEAPANKPLAQEFLRQLHALKGGVLVYGVEALVKDIQYLESCTAAFLKGELQECDALFALLGRYVSRLEVAVDLLRMQQDTPLSADGDSQQTVLDETLPELSEALLASDGILPVAAERQRQGRWQPFSQRLPRLRFLVERASIMLGKPVQLVVQGEELAFPCEVMEKLIAPLELLLWNAIDHGIESREARVAAGKPENGEIMLSLALSERDSTVMITIADDGAGIDEKAVRQQALKAGCVTSAKAATQAGLAEMVCYPGLSTTATISPVSGRGMGLDVVNSEVARLGGQVQVKTIRGQGTRFILSVPL